MAILVTGGAGFIGSHTCLSLLQADKDVVVVDNLSNSSEESVRRVRAITGKSLAFIKADLLDKAALVAVFQKHKIEAVIHFAGLKAVGESVSKPLLYYRNNVEGTLNLLAAMKDTGVRDFIFSSSATVYGDPERVPIAEAARLAPTNPYGHTKRMIEIILDDLRREEEQVDGKNWRIVLLRYFNPVGAHKSGRIGEDPNDIPNNLLPFITRVAVGKLKELSVFGSDYPTHDGTGVRDYIHVMDLAEGHLAALDWLARQQNRPLCEVFNLGTGKGYSVLDVICAFERQSGVRIPYRLAGRRPGDIAACYADASRAESVLGWKARYALSDMMRDAWNWQKNNPDGYR